MALSGCEFRRGIDRLKLARTLARQLMKNLQQNHRDPDEAVVDRARRALAARAKAR
jgi:hypothetical protein